MEQLLMQESALIDVDASEDITVGSLTTTNSSTNAVNLNTTAGGVVDGGDTDIDVVAAGRLVISAATGVDLDTNVGSIDITNLTSGAVNIDESNTLSIIAKLDNNGTGANTFRYSG